MITKVDWSNVKQLGILGDSVSKGVGTTKTYADILAKKSGATLVNLAKSSATFSSARENNVIEQAKQLTNCDVVIIQGTDDDWNRSIPVEGSGTSNFIGGFKEILRTVYRNNPKTDVIVISPTLQRYKGGDRTAATPNEINKKLYDYTDSLREECKKQQIEYLDCMKSYFWGMPDEEAFLFYFADGVHPNEKGHEVIERKIR